MKKMLYAVFGLFFASQVYADMITFNDFTYNTTAEIDWVVTIDNEGDLGYYNFNVEIASTSAVTADILGFGFNTSIDYGPSILDNIINSTVALSECENNCNWNGSDLNGNSIPMIMNTVQTGENGSPGGVMVTSFSFSIDGGDGSNPQIATEPLSLTEDTFTTVAIRAQSVEGADGVNSVKDYSSTPCSGDDCGHGVPELNVSGAPIAMSLILAIIAIRREKRKKDLIV